MGFWDFFLLDATLEFGLSWFKAAADREAERRREMERVREDCSGVFHERFSLFLFDLAAMRVVH